MKQFYYEITKFSGNITITVTEKNSRPEVMPILDKIIGIITEIVHSARLGQWQNILK